MIQQIILLVPSFSYRRFHRTFTRLITSFGWKTCFDLFLALLLAHLCDRLFRFRFYSIEKVAQIYQIPVTKVSRLHSQELYRLIENQQGTIVFTQVNQRLKPELLQRGTFWNKHCGLLPSYKGVYPVFWALLHGESNLGVTIHLMNEQFDDGRVLSQVQISSRNLTFFKAYHALYDVAGKLMLNLGLRNTRQTVEGEFNSSYYSFPTATDREKFRKSHRFGFPFRLHPPVEPNPERLGRQADRHYSQHH